MAPERPRGAGAFPKPVESPAPDKPGSGRALCCAGSGHEQLPHADCPAEGQPVPCGRQLLEIGAARRTGWSSTGRLSPRLDGRGRCRPCEVCQQKIKRHNVQRMRLVATEACRRAQNARDFIRQVQRETGLKLEIIQPEEEARLAVISCAPLVSTKTEQLLVVDIGGGSTELVWIDLSSVPHRDRPRAIMRLHAGLPSGSTARFPRPRWWTGSRCRWASRRCATSSRTSRTTRRASR